MPAEHAEPDNLVLQPRDVHFDWANTPMHWLPGDPFASHLINVLHLLLPEGERWFVRTFQEALPLIVDNQLREDVLGFIGQEAIHAETHEAVLLEQLKAKGLDPAPYVRQAEWIFHRVLAPKDGASERERHEHLIERLSVIAAIEHFTAYLGDFALNAKGWDAPGVDPTMVDLFRWHGAEEVEHRSVAFNVARYFDRRYFRRVRAMALAVLALLLLFGRGVRFLMLNDPTLHGAAHQPRWRDYFRGVRAGSLPSLLGLAISVLRYFKPSYHPTQEGSTEQAIAYLATSPAARAAAR
ncbi:MAG TPA: metal-dependent hydrolase [Pseudonocardiaceae bacterium]|nr:metal-dependent hydrolase [Pseudonocardiaceae bacterium]